MKINLYPTFIKHYRKRIDPNLKLHSKAQERINPFKQDSRNPILKNHQLSGAKRHLRSFSITGNFRLTYRQIDSDEVEFMDIGTHLQVY